MNNVQKQKHRQKTPNASTAFSGGRDGIAVVRAITPFLYAYTVAVFGASPT